MMAENQTQFNLEEPLYEDVRVVEVAKTDVPKQSFFKTKKGVVFIAAGSFLLLMLLLILLMPRRNANTAAEPTPQPAVVLPEKTGFELRIDNLQQELERADPSDTVLPFPAVDMEIELEDSKNQ